MPLHEYRRKRDAGRTSEPVPDWEVPDAPADHTGDDQDGRGDTFVIQEHHARALHWDVRLERDGVLVSWAVPKGLPLDPATNHLAKQTEDHPMPYATFEGEIPKGEYGGGTVTIWAAGTYELQTWTDREVKVVLHGDRVDGRYVFFRTRGQDWMVHRMDGPPPGWQPPPSRLAPMLAYAGPVPRGPGWAFEFKWDGVRALGYVEGGRLQLLSRNDRDITGAYPELRSAAERLGSTQLVLDGEIVALDPVTGRPDFGLLQRRMHVDRPAQATRLARQVPTQWFVFDVLYVDGRPLLDLPYGKRREVLETLDLPFPVPPSLREDGATVLKASRAQGLEGIVAKRLRSPYRPGQRSDDWVKVKIVHRQEVVVGGWEQGAEGRATSIGALLLGTYDEAGGLRYAGQVGTGFTQHTLGDLTRRLAPLRRATSPFADEVPRLAAQHAIWVEPALVAEVEFGSWTRDGRLRHPSFKGLRDDCDPRSVRREL